MGSLLQTLRGMGPARLGMMGAVMVGMLVFFFFLTSRMSTGQLGTLYTDLPTGDSAAIVQKLDTMQVPYTVSADGTSIKVPIEQVGKLRMAMAGDGLPSGGGVGYEIFDKQNGFGTTTFVQNINQVRALEGELARTISSVDGIRAARVNLVLPQRELFAKESQPATASVFLTLRGSVALSREQVAAIQHLVAAAVPQLKPTAISIIDNAGNLLARGSTDGTDTIGSDGQSGDDMKHQFEAHTQQQIEDLIGRTVGYGHVRASVTSDMDFDRTVTSEEKFDPEGSVPRSTQTVEEKSTSSEGGGGGSVSVANNLPGGAAAGGAAAGAGGNTNNRTEETTNYEIGKKEINTVKQGGTVKRLSVAVLVDGNYTTDDKGKQTYAPRSQDEMSNYEELIKSAIGFDANRGDTIKVENMQFAKDAEAAPEPTLPLGFTKDDLTKLLETVVLGLVAIMFILLVVRPLTTRVMATMPATPGGGFAPGAGGGGNQMLTDQTGAGGAPQLGGPNQFNAEQLAERAMSVDSEIERMINLEQVEGRVRASSLKKISEIVDKHPDQAVSILRNWLYQEPNR